MNNSNLENTLRGGVGLLIVLSVALTFFVSPWFMLFTGVIGASLFQSAFTDWCIVLAILRRRDPGQCGCELK